MCYFFDNTRTHYTMYYYLSQSNEKENIKYRKMNKVFILLLLFIYIVKTIYNGHILYMSR
jgi:hypothetical protein